MAFADVKNTAYGRLTFRDTEFDHGVYPYGKVYVNDLAGIIHGIATERDEMKGQIEELMKFREAVRKNVGDKKFAEMLQDQQEGPAASRLKRSTGSGRGRGGNSGE